MLRQHTVRAVIKEVLFYLVSVFLKKNFILDCNLAQVISLLRNRFILMYNPRNITSAKKVNKNVFFLFLGFNEELFFITQCSEK